MSDVETKKLTLSKKNSLEKLLLKYLDCEDEFKSSEIEFKAIKVLVQKAFTDLELNNYKIQYANAVCKSNVDTFTKVKKKNVRYDISLIKKKLKPKVYNKFFDKTYVITDYEYFKKLMQENDVPLENIKNCVSVHELVDGAKLQQMHEVGNVNIKELKGCYTVDTTEYMMHRSSKEK